MSNRYYNPRYNVRYDNLYGPNYVDDYRDDYRYTDNDVDLYADEIGSRYGPQLGGAGAGLGGMGHGSAAGHGVPGSPFGRWRPMEQRSLDPTLEDRYVPAPLRTPLHNPFESEDGLSEVSPDITRQEYRNLMAHFRKFDRDGNGTISPRELQQQLKNADSTYFSAGTIRLIFQIFDKDDSNSLDINEFYYLLKALKYWNIKFKQFDLDSSGTITFTEYLKLLRYFGYTFNVRTCAFIFKKFARFDEHASVFRRTGNKLVLKFDKFFESFIMLTYFFNQYGMIGTNEHIDSYLIRCFGSIERFGMGNAGYNMRPGYPQY